ncbi:tetratricopeptide repeat protein [Acidisphaera sp. S103]|uniref:tetratricopeptide repeat protein n=1 Tax=Acidisphaera sp. S103 TaxID=1747223 RepID=UPI00131D7372|nr:tetratricopeptide repeat protein [Acidisphaera sp. S103]
MPPVDRTDTDLGPDVENWLHSARDARERGQMAEARAVLERAAQRFPASPAVLHDAARAAEAMRDWPDAERHWRGFLAVAPHMWWAHTGLANALREQDQPEAADAVLAGQFVRFAGEPWLFFEYARLAERGENWAEAARRWEDATARFPALWEGHGGQARMLRQLGNIAGARQLLREAVAAFPDMAQPHHDIARLAEADGDWTAAEQAWRAYLVRDEAPFWAHTGLALALRRQQRFAAADSVLEGQRERFGQEPGFLLEYAAVADDRGDWATAADRYRIVLDRFPDQPFGTLGLVYMLARMGRRTEGDDVLRQAIAAHPNDWRLWRAFVRNIAEIGAAGVHGFLERAQRALTAVPDEPESHGYLADALAANLLFDRVEECLASACARFPGSADLLRRHASNLAQQGQWDRALAVYDDLDRVHPPNEAIERERVAMLLAAGRWDEADARLAVALERFPGAAELHVARLDGMIGSGQLDRAVEQWRAIEVRFGSSASVGGPLFERRTRLLGLGYDPVETTPSVAQPAMQAAAVAAGFESLGGLGLGCEFGLFQRWLGLEPLGLLRWADIDVDGLASALETGFEGVGEPDQTDLETTGGTLDEYVSVDRRFGIRLHTYVPAGQVSAERMLAQTCRRLSFLRRKLLDDLRRAEKIFVYKHARRVLTSQELERIGRAIRVYGDGMLLYVRWQNEQHRFPAVNRPAPNVLVGYMDTMGVTPDGNPLPIPYQSWTTLITQARVVAATQKFGLSSR